MNLIDGSVSIIPLPALPPSADPMAVGVGLRQFGILEEDLSVNFDDPNIPVLTTAILNHCTPRADESLSKDFFRHLSVGKRLECMLRLAAGADSEPFSFPFECDGCGVELEMELTLEDIAEIQAESDVTELVGVDLKEGKIVIRKPTGLDQEKWSGDVFEDEEAAARAMFESLLVESDVAPETVDLDFIDDELDSADPLVNFQCRIGCGECGFNNSLRIDLCAVALGKLRRQQQQLIVLIHKLASHYHWSEPEIFRIPQWRRLEYLNLIQSGR